MLITVQASLQASPLLFIHFELYKTNKQKKNPQNFTHLRYALLYGPVSSKQVPHMVQTCYSGPEMCKPGSSKTYTTLLPRTGLSQAGFCTNAALNAFMISATFP